MYVCLTFLVSTYSLDDYAGVVALLQRKPTRLNASDVQHFGEGFYDPKNGGLYTCRLWKNTRCVLPRPPLPRRTECPNLRPGHCLMFSETDVDVLGLYVCGIFWWCCAYPVLRCRAIQVLTKLCFFLSIKLVLVTPQNVIFVYLIGFSCLERSSQSRLTDRWR